jgi:hypothetical protein
MLFAFLLDFHFATNHGKFINDGLKVVYDKAHYRDVVSNAIMKELYAQK